MGNRLLCYNCRVAAFIATLSSSGALSTLSQSSNTSHGSYSPTPLPTNQKPPSPLAIDNNNISLVKDSMQGETIPRPNAVMSQMNNSRQPQPLHYSSYLNLSSHSQPELAAHDPNRRLHQKILQHLEANKNFKAQQVTTRAEAYGSPNSKQEARRIISHPQLDGSIPHMSVQSTRDVTEYRQRKQPTADEAQSAVDPRSPTPTETDNRLSASAKLLESLQSKITPRAAPIDLAIPAVNSRRSHGARRRLPLSDMIMQRKIAESLKKSLTGSRPSSPPQGPISPPLRFSSTQQPLRLPTAGSPVSPFTSGRPRLPSPPHYMKVWQASEIAHSRPLAPPMATEQAPVQSQELPPKLPPQGEAVQRSAMSEVV